MSWRMMTGTTSNLKLSLIKDVVMGFLFCYFVASNIYHDHQAIFGTTIDQKSIHDENQPTVQRMYGATTRSTTTTTTTANTIMDNNDTPIPLDVLVESHKNVTCNISQGLVPIFDQIIPFDSTITQSLQQRKIPRIVHLTAKSRCLTKSFRKNVLLWYFPDHSVYFHDDAAMDRLLERYYPVFPHLQFVTKCVRSGAAKSDLWRYLVLWEYGGIYTDIDNAPGTEFNSNTTIALDDDSFFIVESLGVLSQYFMAASPKHPLLYFAIQVSLLRLLEVPHVGKVNIPVVTGPGALKEAFRYFMRTHTTKEHGRVKEGHYVGVANRSVTVKGTKKEPWKLVHRNSVPAKFTYYKRMNMTHFSNIAKLKFNESCLVHLYNREFFPDLVNLTNW